MIHNGVGVATTPKHALDEGMEFRTAEASVDTHLLLPTEAGQTWEDETFVWVWGEGMRKPAKYGSGTPSL